MSNIGKWVTDGITEETINWTDQFAKALCKKPNPLTTSQIRRFYGEVKRIQSDFDSNRSSVLLLKPKLAYAVGRDKAKKEPSKIKDFYDQIQHGLNAIGDNSENYQRFVDILESIVAFHKFHGGD